ACQQLLPAAHREHSAESALPAGEAAEFASRNNREESSRTGFPLEGQDFLVRQQLQRSGAQGMRQKLLSRSHVPQPQEARPVARGPAPPLLDEMELDSRIPVTIENLPEIARFQVNQLNLGFCRDEGERLAVRRNGNRTVNVSRFREHELPGAVVD